MEALRKEKRRADLFVEVHEKKTSRWRKKKFQEKQRLLNRTPEVKLAEDAARTAAKAAKNLK